MSTTGEDFLLDVMTSLTLVLILINLNYIYSKCPFQLIQGRNISHLLVHMMRAVLKEAVVVAAWSAEK